MIISASRRTDIPAYYSEWFMNRIREGFVYVRNPMNIHQVSHVALTPEVVDGIVFWTKNPIPMLPRLDELKEYMYYFQFTNKRTHEFNLVSVLPVEFIKYYAHQICRKLVTVFI